MYIWVCFYPFQTLGNSSQTNHDAKQKQKEIHKCSNIIFLTLLFGWALANLRSSNFTQPWLCLDAQSLSHIWNRGDLFPVWGNNGPVVRKAGDVHFPTRSTPRPRLLSPVFAAFSSVSNPSCLWWWPFASCVPRRGRNVQTVGSSPIAKHTERYQVTSTSPSHLAMIIDKPSFWHLSLSGANQVHRPSSLCRPFTLETSANAGRIVVATR